MDGQLPLDATPTGDVALSATPSNPDGPARMNCVVYRGVPRTLRFTMTVPGSIAGWTTVFTARTDEYALDYTIQLPGTVVNDGSDTTVGVIDVRLPKDLMTQVRARDYEYSLLRTTVGVEDVLARATMRVREDILHRAVGDAEPVEPILVGLEQLGVPLPAPAQLVAVSLWYDRPLQIVGTDPITLTVRSSDPAQLADLVLPFSPSGSHLSHLNTLDPKGQAQVVFLLAPLDLTGLAGLTFTADDTCARVGWDQLRDLANNTVAIPNSLAPFLVTIEVAPPPPPPLHAATHEVGQTDPLSVTLLAGYPDDTPALRTAGPDQFLSAARSWATPPTQPHAITHEPGGSDALTALSAAILTSGLLPDARLSGNVQLKPVAESDVTGLAADLAAKAPLASPALTGTPTAPTAVAGARTTQIATTTFVTDAVALVPAGPPGPPGAPGPAGGILQGDQWAWLAAATTAPVAAGRLGVDAAAPSLATHVWLSHLAGTAAAVDWSVVLATMIAGDKIYLQAASDSTVYARYTLTGAPTLSAGTWVIPVVWTNGQSEPADGAIVVVAFQRMADFPAHHATHEPGGSDALTALSAAILTTGVLPDARLSGNVQLKPVAESDVTGLVADLAAKAPVASPSFTGLPTAPTAPPGTTSPQIATTAFVAAAAASGAPAAHHATHETGGSDALTALSAAILTSGLLPDARLSATVQLKPVAESDVTGLVADLAAKAPVASPAFSGTPTAPTAGPGTTTTQIATTAFVGTAVAAGGGSAPVTQTITLTGPQHNVALTANCTLLRCTNASLLSITGFAAGVDGQRLTILAEGAGHVALTPELAGTGSLAANRLTNTVTKGDTMLAAGVGSASYIYDGTRTRWKLLTHEQGAAIAVPYNLGDFTANSGTWTVDAGDVTQFNYYLQGKRLTIQIYLAQTSISATPTNLRIALPNGYVCGNTSLVGNLEYLNNTTWTDSGHFEFTVNNTYVVLWTIYQSTWATASQNCWMQGSASCDLQ